MGRKFLTGLSNLGANKITADDEKSYACEPEYLEIPDCMELSFGGGGSPTIIYADDKPAATVNGTPYVDLTFSLLWLPVEIIAKLKGIEENGGVIDVNPDIEAPKFSISFACQLSESSGYRVFRYYSAQYISHGTAPKTKPGSASLCQYTLALRCFQRNIDGTLYSEGTFKTLDEAKTFLETAASV